MASAMFSNALKSFSSNISSNYYEKSASPVSYCGPWKVFDAKKKKTNQPVSIFVFERRSLDNGSSGSGSALSLRGSSGPKAAQDEVVERLKHEANLLARLRHPCVLELVEPVEETRSGGLQFVTEHVTGSLATLLAEKDGDERSGGTKYVQGDDGRRRRREVEIDELEIQKGLLQIGKALEFLHEQANLIHGNLTPEAVMVNAKSDWKVCGFGFTVPSLNPPLPPNFDPRIPQNVQQQLDYAAPELVLDQSFSPSCDLFSLGVLIVTLYNSPRKSPIESHNSTSAYRRIISSPQTVPNASNNYLSKRLVPRQLTGTVLPQLITRRPTGRMTARDFQQSEYFDNILVSTLRFLDNFPAKTPSEKAAFMRGLPKILPQFPKSVLEKKILPGLVEELRDGSLLALILPNIFLIVESAPARLFSEKVLKRLKNVFILPGGAPATSTSEPRSAAAKITERDRDASKEGGLTVILSKLALIKHKTTAQEFKEDILPLVHLALESPTHALQDLAMRCLPTILPKLDFPTLKNDLFPVVSTVFIKTSSLGIKIRGLEAFRVLCGGIESEDNTSDGLDGFSNKTGKLKSDEAPVLDKYTIQEKVIPLLKGIKTKEPAVMMEALSVFNEIGKVCDREVVAMDILPTLWTMSFGPLLGLEQFKSFMTTIKFLSQKIETEQVRKLQELSSTIGVQTAGEFLSFGGAPGQQAMNGKTSPGGASDTDFESLVFGKKDGGQAAIKDGFDWQTPLADSNRSPVERMGTTSPMSGNKGSSTLSVSATTFSWSTPSSNATSQGPKFASSSSGLSSVNSFATLQPSSSAGKGMPSMASAGFGSTTALRPQQTNRPVSNRDNDSSNTVLDWSTSIMSKPPFPSNINSNTRSNSTPPGNQATGQSFVAIGATSNSNSNNSNILGNIGLGISPQTSGLSKPGGGIQLTNFGMGMSSPSSTTINKPFTTSQSSKAFSNLGGTNMGWGMGSGTNTGGMNMNTNMSMSNMGITMKEDKKGLDKWESLI